MRIRFALLIVVVALSVIVSAAVPALPQGNGLAAQYPNDAGIGSDPAVIFADDFESYSSVSSLTTKWSSAPNGANTSIATTAGNVFGGAKALEFTLPAGTAEVSGSVLKNLSPERDLLFLRFYSKYDPAFNIVGSSHNGAVIQAHYCCPGVKADGFDKFLVSYEASKWDSSPPNPGHLNVYVYYPDQRDGYGDHFYPTGTILPFSSPNPPNPFGPDFVSRPNVAPPLGVWKAYEMMVKANTPGQRDGRIAMWLDGVLIADFMNLRLRETTALKMDLFYLNFHVNAPHPVQIKKWYDNVVLATSYIGPTVTGTTTPPAPPTNVRIVSGQ